MEFRRENRVAPRRERNGIIENREHADPLMSGPCVSERLHCRTFRTASFSSSSSSSFSSSSFSRFFHRLSTASLSPYLRTSSMSSSFCGTAPFRLPERLGCPRLKDVPRHIFKFHEHHIAFQFICFKFVIFLAGPLLRDLLRYLLRFFS